jgi:allantoinase
MPLPDDYLTYPMRRYGMDHDRYDWSILQQRPPVTWPGGARVALWIVPVLEFFPLNQPAKPFRAPGGMVTPYPDLRHYSLRDYGNRVGVWRVFDALARRNLKASVVVSSRLAERYPLLIEAVSRNEWELVAGGVDMGTLHYGGLDEAAEAAQIADCLRVLRGLSGQTVTGWLSPARSQSALTPDLLAEAGITWQADWANDDMPYPFRTRNGSLTAMPLSLDLDDQTILTSYRHSEAEFVEQVIDAFETLWDEAGDPRLGGRILSLTIHPWVSGQPHRIAALENLLDFLSSHKGVWSATGSEILAAWQAGQTASPESAAS